MKSRRPVPEWNKPECEFAVNGKGLPTFEPQCRG